MSLSTRRKREAQRIAIAKCERDGWSCHWCGEPLWRETLTADHVVPQARGGAEDEDNIVPACYPCNHTRNDGVEEFAARLEGLVFNGAGRRKVRRLAVQHYQLVAWLAEAGCPLTVEMQAHLTYLGALAEAADWPVFRSDSPDTLALLAGCDPERARALQSLRRLRAPGAA